MKINKSNIIITGAANGIGKALALNFASMGGKVAAIDISSSGLEKLKQKVPSVEIYNCDISDGNEVQRTVDKIYDNFKTIDILINNAGVMHSAPVVRMGKNGFDSHDYGEWDKIISVNLTGYFYMATAVLNKMVTDRTKGVIVNFSSISANGNAGQSAYAASKAAVEALTKTWAKEFGYFGIRSVAIAPGFIDTEGTHEAINDATLKSWEKKVPLKRLGTIEEVVNAVSMMVTNDYFNGRVIQLDGGLVI
jgi:3-oxoacyl-[acyl-carrier protein] reductase